MPNECPGVETIAAYVDRCLSLDERRQMEAHLANCGFCREIISLVLESKEIVPDPIPPDLTNPVR